MSLDVSDWLGRGRYAAFASAALSRLTLGVRYLVFKDSRSF